MVCFRQFIVGKTKERRLEIGQQWQVFGQDVMIFQLPLFAWRTAKRPMAKA